MDGGVREELVRVAQEWDRAMVENSAEAIGRYMADDWTIIGPDGSVGDKATFLALVKSGALSHDVMESNDMQVRVYRDTAVVTAWGGIGRKVPRAGVPRGGALLLRLCQAGGAVEVRVNPPLAACTAARRVKQRLSKWELPRRPPRIPRAS